MCGIAGFVAKRRIKEEHGYNILGTMLNQIKHRGPDGEGAIILDEQVGLGHRRLSILDLSTKGSQPMSYANERYWITYNGEIYNYIEIRNELKEKGHHFVSDCDTEVVLASYQQWGSECVHRFNGMWSFVIYDREEGIIFCSRDRFGVKPFYYSDREKGLFFASEIKEIIAINEIPARANNRKIEAYLLEGIIEGNNETMFQNIFQLCPGQNLLLNCNTMEYRIVQWYSLESVSLKTEKREGGIIFRELFEKSVRLRLRSDVPIGSCLSGGLDSSSIACMVKYISPETQLHTITSCFENKKYDEYNYASIVNQQINAISHRVFPQIEKAFIDLDKIIWHMDEPFEGLSMYAQWEVFSEAKKNGLKVMLDGQGADEQLAGYYPFHDVLYIKLIRRFKLISFVNEWNESHSSEQKKDIIINGIRKYIICLTTCLLPIRLKYAIALKEKKGEPIEKGCYSNPFAREHFCAYDKRYERKYTIASMLRGMQNLLHYEDRNSMAHSIEARVPFLDKELAEFIYRQPIEKKIAYGKTKNILREGLKDLLPYEIYNRKDKMGFVTPQIEWMRQNKVYIRNELITACGKLNMFLCKDKVLKWFDESDDSKEWKYNFCFRVICLAHWASIFKVRLEA